MNKKEILLICLILCFICSVPAVASADTGLDDTNNVTLAASHADAVSASNDLSSYSHSNNQILRGENDDAGSFSDLQNKIDTATDSTIILDKNYTYNSTDGAIMTTGIVVNGVYTIEGQTGKNITIDGSTISRLFTLNGTITFRNINFVNGFNAVDSPIYSNGTLTVENSHFGNGLGIHGGAIHAVGGLNVYNSTFSNNKAIESGGSIFISDSSLTSVISGCNFTKDMALSGDGGSISSASSLLTLQDLKFNGCKAINDGGAIMLSGHNTTITNVNITGCTATNNGGAIYFKHNHKVLSNLRFESNNANRGGAIYCNPECDGVDDGGLENVTFIGNTATISGGAMYVSGNNGRITNATFENNRATNDGGAIYINGTGWGVYNSTFDINTASIGYGGAMYITSGTGITIDYCNFTSNLAGYGGGAINGYDNTDNALINNSRFIRNVANAGDGGAIYWYGSHSTIEKSYFESNNATSISTETGFGGAVAICGSYDAIDNCTFIRNRASLNGGAVVIRNTIPSINSTIRDTIFEYNSAGRNGGGVCWSPSCPNGTVINSTFRHNSAGGSAGALGMQSDYGYVYNSTFEHNRAFGTYSGEHPGNGGAMTFVGNHNYAYNCTYINNTAASHGGGAYVKSTEVKNNNDTTFELCRFINNTAEKNGGAVDWSAGSINGHILTSTFTNNTAKRSGGAVHWSGTNGQILYSNFTHNRALGEITDANGGGDGGAVIWLGSHGEVDHCNFTDNFAQYRGGAVFLKGESESAHCNDTNFTWCRFENNTAGLNGGAVDWQSGANNGRLIHGVFINNTAWRSGGAVFWYGTNGTVDDCNFTDNRAIGNVTKDDRKALENVYTTVGGNGGAIVWTGSTGSISNANFDDNYAKCLGGAIFLELNENVSIRYANFTDNWADINGGAIDWYKGAANGRVEHVKFINNTAKRSGGAIYWYGHNGTLHDVTFINNTALGQAYYINPFGENTTGGDGGAIFWTGYDGNVTVSKFINNTAAKRGGAVFLQGATDFECNNTRFKTALFENNTAGTNGGAVDWFKGATHGVIDNATFNNNVANRSGGAVYWNGDHGDILNSNFTNNCAKGITYAISSYGENTTGGSGGAIIWSGSNGIVDNCRFIDNNASKHGGAVYLQGTSQENCTNTTFNLCYFEGNNATINGGALDWHHGAHDGLINNSQFRENRARANGGAVYWEGHHGDILNSNFTYNYALGAVSDDEGNQGDGGAIIWAGLNGDVDNCWFWFNNASARGGAVYLHSCDHGNNNTTFANSHFINNTAGTNGGAIDWHEGAEYGLVDNTEFINNTAGVNGGAIFWNGDHGSVVDSNFTHNFATQNGGAVYWEGHIGVINGSTFKYNNVSGFLNSTRIVNYHNENTGIDEVHYDILGGDGGAIIWKGCDAVIENSTFYKNYAPYRGGAIFFTNMENESCTNVTIKKGNFTENYAAMNGGAIDWASGASNATILSSHFIRNVADRSAGAIYVRGNGLEIKDSEFNHNRITGNTLYDNRTNVMNFTSIGGNAGAICWMGSYGTVENVTFLNNTATQRGGAIQFERNVNGTVKDSRFINNSAGTEGGAIDFYNGAENGKIINSNFTNNTAQENGGAIYWQGHHGTISGSRFENNRAIGLGDGALVSTTTNPSTGKSEKRYNITGGDGGAIKWTGSHGIIENSTFYGNNATYNGGAIYLIGNETENCTNITLIDCNFTHNLAKLNGGAVYWAKGASDASVSGSHFTNNTAARSAGAIYISGNYLEIKDTDFRFNDAVRTQTYDNRSGSSFFSSLGGNAGAICWMGSYGTVDNGTFINNTAAERGGAIQFERNENGTVKNSHFENNSAYDDGGAIDWYLNAVNGQLINSTFRTNIITGPNGRGSGVYIEGFNATIKDSRFYKHNSNADGGVVYIEGDESSVENSTFEDINSNKRGGAIYIAGDNTTVVKSNFTDVHADNEGGAIYVTGANTNITASKFDGTYSLTNGGAIYVRGNNTYVSDSNITDSQASGSGGAIYISGISGTNPSENTTIVHCQFESCKSNSTSANQGGGAIYINHANNTNISYSVFKDNSAKMHAGAIFVEGQKTTVQNSNFTSNKASGNGGAIYVAGDETNIIDCNLTKNNATNGAGIYVDGHYNNITSCNLTSNRATTKGGGIYVTGSNTHIIYSNFTKNGAYGGEYNGGSGDGGALYVDGRDSSLKYSNFDFNEARGNGGAVLWKGGYPGSEFIGCNFTSNRGYDFSDLYTGAKGGAVYFTDNRGATAPGSIKDCIFTNNSAFKHGGAIDWFGANNGLIDNCDFIENFCVRGDGAAIYSGDTGSDSHHLTVSNCSFIGNKAVGTPNCAGAISNQMRDSKFINNKFINNTGSYGGAIVMKDSKNGDKGRNSIIFNCTFINCTTYGGDNPGNGGGACYIANQNITIDNCTFENCSARFGGAIHTKSKDTKIYNSTFTDNRAASGGAVYASGEAPLIRNSTFDNNTAGFFRAYQKSGNIYVLTNYYGDGGAVFLDTGAKNALIYICSFENNTINKTTSTYGGAIYAMADNSVVNKSNFTNNSADYGGAIYFNKNGNNGQNYIVDDSKFELNHGLWGGAVYLNSNQISLVNSRFNNNSATDGGSIYIKDGFTDRLIDNCTFANGSSDENGGDIYVRGSSVEIKNITSYNATSTKGGSILLFNSDDIVLSNITVHDAVSTENGGAIFVDKNSDNNNFNNITVTGSKAVNGGAIYMTGSSNTVTNVTLANNSATNGGSIYVANENNKGLNNKFINVTADNSTASQNGGAIYWAAKDGNVTLIVVKNSNALNGGAIFVESTADNLRVTNANFTNNTATNGGAVYWKGTNGILDNAAFIKNHAENGGAVYWADVSSKFTNTEFYNNTATYGGAVYWYADGGSIVNSTMMFNRAVNGSAIYSAKTLSDIINAVLLNNQAHSYEIYNSATSVIQRNGNSIEVYTLFRGNDNILNAIHNIAGDMYFTNVTYWGVGGERNTGNDRRKPVVLAADALPTDENEIYQTNLEANQNITTYVYDRYNKIAVNMTDIRTDFSGAIRFIYTNESLLGDELNIKMFHPEDDYYTYIAFSNRTKLPGVIVEAEDIYFHEIEILNITVWDLNETNPQVPTGNITLYLNGEIYYNITVDSEGNRHYNPWHIDENGKVSVPVPGLHVDHYKVYVAYSGDGNFVPEYNSTSFNVLMINSTISVYVPDHYYGDHQKLIIRTIENASNNVSIIMNGNQYWVYVNDTGYAELDVPILNAGNYTVEAFYPETRDCYASSNSTTFEVWKVNSTINITGIYDDNYNTVRLHVDVGPGGTVGNVVVTFNGKDYELSLTNSSADLTVLNVPRGIYEVNATYGGDMNHWGSNNTTLINATKFATPIIIDAMNITYGENETVIFTLPANVTGNLTINISGRLYNEEIVNGTVVIANLTLAAGNYSVIAEYGGDKNYMPSTNSTRFIVAKAKPVMDPIVENIIYGDTENITVNINQTGNVSIIIRDLLNPENIIIQNLTINITNGRNVTWNISDLPRGEYLAEFIFSGNQNYTGCEMNRTFVVDYATPLIIVEVDDINVGQNATVNVTVYPRDKVTGNVTIYVDGIDMGTFTLDGTGFTQLFNVSGLLNGTHDAVAVYHGDNNYTHRDNSTTFGVYKHDPLMSVTGLNVTVVDDEIIRVNLPANATGIVYVRVNDTQYFINLTAGEREINIGKLPNGTYNVFANYTGDYFWNSVTNTTLFNITKLDSIISVSVDNITYGDKAVINITTSEGICGNVTVNVNGTDYTAYVSGGHGLLVLDDLNVGEYPVTVTFDGCAKYLPNSNGTTFRVSKVNATPDIKVIDQGNGTVVVVLPGNATGEVNITVGNKTFNATVINGTAVVVLENVTPGVNNITVFYSGDGNYTNITVNATANIPKLPTPIGVTVHNIYVGDVEEITVTLPENATGTVTIKINGITYTNSTVVNGNATFRVPNLAYGNKTVAVIYSGNANYSANFTTANFTVNKRISHVNVTASATVVGSDAVVNVTIPANATGYVIVNVNGTKYNVNTTNGNGSVVLKGLGNGTYKVNVTYIGDDQYFPSANGTEFTIGKVNTPITINASSVVYGNDVNITVNVTSGATGFITVKVVNASGTVRNITLPVVNGKVSWIVGGLAVDSYTVYANYSGDAKYNINDTNKMFNVIKATPVITIEPVEVSSARNATVIVHITPGTTGVINITVNNENYSGPIVDGVARIVIKQLSSGNYTVNASYSGDRNFTDASAVRDNAVNVHKFACYDMNVSAPDTKVGLNTTIVVNVPLDAVGEVAIYVNDSWVGNATISHGVAKLNVTKLYEGKYVVNATFGDAKYANKTVTTNYHVIKWDTPMNITVNDAKVGDRVEVIVSLPGDIRGEVVTIEINGKKYTNVTDNVGNATFYVDNVTYGNKTVTATYMGNNKYVFNSTTRNFTVTKRNSQVNVTASASVVGLDAVVNVTIPANATGYVIVNVNGTNYTVNTTNGNGSVVIKNLGNGYYTVNVTYIGDDQYLSSTNGTDFAISRIQPAFSVNGITITYGETELIEFESVENITAPVKVEIGGRNYTAVIVEGKGSLNVSDLAAGNYNVTVYFEGNYKYLNASANNTFTVEKAVVPVIVVPQNITFTELEYVTVYVNATGTVDITVDHITVSDIPIEDGKVVFRTFGYLTAGNYTAYVRYNGNQNYTVSSAEANFTVSKKDPVITVEVQNITYGGKEHIIVRVNARGNVTIKVNGTESTIVLREDDLAVEILRTTLYVLPNYDGRAHEYLYNLDAGIYPVEVIFNGNENYNVASAKTFFVVAKQNTTANVKVDSIMVGGSEVINVTINSTNVTGNVVINVDGINYTRPLTDGKANLTLKNLSAGNHSVVVIYRGDNNFRGNWTSATFSLSKVKPELTIKVNNTSAGETAKIVVRLPENATGFVVIDVDGTKYHVDIVPGQEIALEIDNLLNKTYNVTAEYSGDDYWDVARNESSFNVNITKADISVKAENITVGDKAVINITTPKELYGNVTVNVDGQNYTVYVAGGNGILIVPGLDVGNYTVSVKFDGNEKFAPNEAATELKVSKINVTSDDIKVIDQGNGTVVVVVGGNATGNATIYVDGKNFTGEVINGTAVIALENVTPGKQNITVVYSGDGTHTNATVNATATIPKLDTPIAVNVTEIIEGETAVVTVTVPENATGEVTVNVDGREFSGKIVNGTAVVYVDNLTAGNKTIVVEYPGDSNYTSNYTVGNFTVGEAKVVPDIRVVDQGNGTVVVVVGGNATGDVSIRVGNDTFNATVVNGTAVVYVGNLTPGNNSVEVVYSGDGTYTNATVNATVIGPKYDTPITVNVTEITEGESVVVTVTVPENATGEVTVNVDGREFSAEIIDGTATILVDNLTAGNKTIVVEYPGDSSYTSNYTVGNFTVAEAKVVPDIRVVDQGNGTVVVVVGGNATGDVTVYVDGKNFTGEVINGTAVIALENVTPGKQNITVVYSGDGTHTNSTINATATIPKLDTPITVDVSEIIEGETAVVTVTVPENATGDVIVTIDGKQFFAEIINGIATILVDNLTSGPKSVIVEYLGDGNYTSNYTVGNFTVGEAKVVPDIRVVDQGNGTVVVVVGGNATGDVSIRVGNDTFNATVVNGTAVVYVGNLTPGNNSVEVVYSGDGTYTNATVNATVNGPKYDTPITVNVTEIIEGETAVVTVTVPENATGTVIITIDGKQFPAELVNGTATVPVDNLTSGPKSVIVEYLGDGNYTSNYTVGNFTVGEAKVVPDIRVVDQGNGTVVVVVGGNATGDVSIRVGNDTFNATVVNGTAVVYVGNLTPGNNSVEVVYSGDGTYTNATVNATIIGPKYDTPITVNVTEITEGESVVVTVTVPENATGNVTITVGGKEYAAEIINGTATILVDNLTAGDKTIVVEYPGDSNYTSNYTVGNFTVGEAKVVPDIKVIDQGNGTVVVVVGDNATGNVTVTVDGKEYTAEVSNGTAVITLDNLTPGINDIGVVYSGDGTHTNATADATVNGPKYETPIEVNISDIKVGETAVITVSVPENATGNVTITIDGQKYTAEIINGTAVVEVENLTEGPKSVIVEYHGDDNYSSNYAIADFTVEKVKTTPEIYVVDQRNGTVVVIVPDNATGNVTIKVGDEEYAAEVINGTAVITLDNLTPGINDIEVIYSGDGTHTNATVDAAVIGPKYDAPIEVTTTVTKVGEDAVIVVSVPEDATGNVTIEVDGIRYTAEVIDGNATFTISNLSEGTRTIAVEYSGDDNYAEGHTTANITMSKVKSHVSATITDINVGENVTITVSVPEDATGQVLIDIDGVGYYVNVTDGVGSIQIPRMPNGIYPVNLTYIGDDKYLPSNNNSVFYVNKLPSYVIPTAKNITMGENEIIVFAVPSDATGIVTVIINGDEFTFDLDEILGVPIYSDGKFTVAVSGGKGVLILSGLNEGEYNVTVKYNGDGKYLESSNSTMFRVAIGDCDINVVDLGNGTVKVFVSDNATGNITINVGNQTYVAEIHDGVAVVNLDNVSAGMHDIEVVYSGDDSHLAKNVNSTVSIPKHFTPIGVTAHDIYVGETEHIVVTVPDDATGIVTIEINAVAYNATIKDGKAIFDVEGLTFGNKTVAVTYWGDENYVANFTTGQFEVMKVPSSEKASSLNIKVGKDEVITVVVPSDATGRVIVTINGVDYSGEIVNGKVKIVVPNLPAGKYEAVVTYEGDDKYLPSVTTTSFKVVNANTPISATGDYIQVGDDASVTINLPKDATGTVTIVIEGKSYTSEVVDGKAVFTVPGLAKGVYDVVVYYSGDDKYPANETVTKIMVVEKHHDRNESGHVHSQGDIGLAKHATGNPIWALLLIVLAIGATGFRRFKK